MRRLFGSRPELDIQLERTAYRAGDSVHGLVLVRSEKEREVDSGEVYLRCVETYEYRKRDRSNRDNRNDIDTIRESDTVIEFGQQFCGQTVLLPGQESQHPFSFTIPAGALPSYEGDILDVRWSVYAKLDLDRALDATEEAAVTVYLPPEGPYPQPRYTSDSAEHEQAGIALTLEGTAFGPGSTIRGVLHIHPRQPFTVEEVRLELHREENVPMREGNTDSETVSNCQVLPQTEFFPGTPMHVPFELPGPSTISPSVTTPHGVGYWELEVILARAWRGDLNLRKGVFFYTLPADRPLPADGH